MRRPVLLFIIALILLLILGGAYVWLLYAEAYDAIASGRPEDSPLPVSNVVRVTCPDCTNAFTDLSDCKRFLNQIKNHQDFLNAVSSMKFDITKLSKIEKRIEINIATAKQEVRCFYYSPA